MTEMKQLIHKRGVLKAHLTKLETFLEKYSSSHLEQLRLRLEKIDNTWNEFNEIQTQIELLDFNQADERDTFEEDYFRIVGQARSLLKSNSNHLPSTSQLENSSVRLSVENLKPQNIKLPTIHLPSFSGLYLDWLNFYDTFKSIIHDNSELLVVHKFHYLKSCLSGDAAHVIQSLDISEENYDIAWKLLIERYANNRLIIQSHVNSIFELPVIVKDSYSSLRKLVDEFQKHVRALKALGLPTDQWDILLLHIITNKLDRNTHKEWENSIKNSEMPTIDQLLKFLQNKCQVLEVIASETSKHGKTHTLVTWKNTHFNKSKIQTFNSKVVSCKHCGQNHSLNQCENFSKLPFEKKFGFVKKLGLCLNCLNSGHLVRDCKSSLCKICHKRHHTLLHKIEIENGFSDNLNQNNNPIASSTDNEPKFNRIVSATSCQRTSYVLLSTALIDILDSSGKIHTCRALLDSGSQSNFMTKSLKQKLNLTGKDICLPVAGIGQQSTNVNQMVTSTIRSRCNNFETILSFLVLDKITDQSPSFKINRNSLNISSNIQLADPKFNIPKQVDILLGAQIFWELLLVGKIKLTNNNQLTLYKTKLGWVISGSIFENSISANQIVCNLSTNNTLEDQVAKFWALENVQLESLKSREQNVCEQYFKRTTKLDYDGRFIVSMPLKMEISHLGASYDIALQRLFHIEKKLDKNLQMRKQYNEFMREYESLNHMTRVENKNSEFESRIICYLPHHPVVRESSSTTKLRVVFDASSKTESGLSLNDLLIVGPTVQSDLLTLILKFRTYRYAITADIEKMYRQILLTPEQRPLQRILWRFDSNDSVQEYELNTLTYGTATAPYLAPRCLLEIAEMNKFDYPLTSKIIKENFYMDDLLAGAQSIPEVKQLIAQLDLLLSKHGFSLRKWTSNNSAVLSEVTDTTCDQKIALSKESCKTLGVLWNANSDSFQYQILELYDHFEISKRYILSATAQIFDPLGLLGPVVVKLKILIQKLWQLRYDWDTRLPPNFVELWIKIASQLHLLNQLSIPRNIVWERANLELHGFCYASQQAYGACIYTRSVDTLGNMKVNLLCAKSRVAPLKTISLPRLELCGALLLAQLISKVLTSFDFYNITVNLWCDSTIVLSWLEASPSRWQTFVANRVSIIQELSKGCKWNHICSEDNPADIISRGIYPEQLVSSDLWWHGPKWLMLDNSEWLNQSYETVIDIPEKRQNVVSLKCQIKTQFVLDLLNRYSLWYKLLRVVAYCYKFIEKLKTKKRSLIRLEVELSVVELEKAHNIIVKLVQDIEFNAEVRDLKQSKIISKNSKLINLSPFLDENCILRVGGRLSLAENLSYDQKHPIILPKNSKLTRLIVLSEHHKNLHAGVKTLLVIIRTKYWPIGGCHTLKSI